MSASKSESPEQFGARLLEYVQGGFVASALSMGKDLYLFDAMKALDAPATSQQIADQANVKERYVREWLGCLVTGNVVEYNVTEDLYFLSADKIKALGDANYFSCWLTRCVGTYPQLMKAMPKDGPPGFAAWEHVDFDTLIQRDKEDWLTEENVDALIAQVPELKQKLEKGIDVCEAGCNTAPFLRYMAKRFPNSKFTAFDLSDKAIKTARDLTNKDGLHNITCLSHNIYNLPQEWNDRYDWVFIADVVHDLPYPDDAIKCLYKIVKSGASFSQVEYNLSSDLKSNMKTEFAKSFYAISMFYCLPASMHFGGPGAGTLWGKENAKNALDAAGFKIKCLCIVPNSEIEVHFVCTK